MAAATMASRKNPQISVTLEPLVAAWLKRYAHAKGDTVPGMVNRLASDRVDTGIRCKDLEKAEEYAREMLPGWKPLPIEEALEEEGDRLDVVAQSVGCGSAADLISAIARGEVVVSKAESGESQSKARSKGGKNG